MTEHLIMGVGHPDRGDDAAGLEVARRLRERDLGATRVAATWGDATDILEGWRGFDSVTIVDATSGAGEVGAIVRLDGDSVGPCPGGLRASSHGTGVAEAIALGRQLGRLPPQLVIYGIEGRRFGVGEAMSPEVEWSVATVARLLAGAGLAARKGAAKAETPGVSRHAISEEVVPELLTVRGSRAASGASALRRPDRNACLARRPARPSWRSS